MKNGRRVGLVLSTGRMLLFAVPLPEARAYYWTFLPAIEVTITNPVLRQAARKIDDL